jgi:hypothetical protein
MLLDLTGKYADLANELDKSQATIYYLWYKNCALGHGLTPIWWRGQYFVQVM